MRLVSCEGMVPRMPGPAKSELPEVLFRFTAVTRLEEVATEETVMPSQVSIFWVVPVPQVLSGCSACR